MVRRSLSRSEGDGGFTLVELLISMFLFALVLTLISAATITTYHTLRKQQGQANDLDASRKVIELLDRQVRYANTVSQPGLGTSGTAQYIEWQSGDSGQSQTCTQWRLDPATSLMQYRSWGVPTNGAAVPAPAWITEATGAVTIGSSAVFTTTALAPGSAAVSSPVPRATVTFAFAIAGGNPRTVSASQLTLTALNSTVNPTTTPPAAAICSQVARSS